VHTENTPPLWYVVVWGVSRVLGTGELALRLPSALAGIATVPVAWGIGWELAGRGVSGRRAAILTAALVAVNPLFVWYSQEARAYAFFVLFAALAMLCMLRADRARTARRYALFALTGALALLSHYFAVFLLLPMALWLLRPRRAATETVPGPDGSARPRRSRSRGSAGALRAPPPGALAAVAVLALVGLALVPLIVAQGGHGTQWIGEWALAARLEAIPQYYLTGYSAAPLGHGVELLVALVIFAGVVFALWRALTPQESDGALIALAIAAAGVLLPVALAVFGADYLAPRNLVAAMVPLSATIAVIVAARRAGRVGVALGALIALAFLVLSVDVDLSPRLQRGDWRGLAQTLSRGWHAQARTPVAVAAPSGALLSHDVPSQTAITTVELGAAPLEYYLPPLHNLARDRRDGLCAACAGRRRAPCARLSPRPARRRQRLDPLPLHRARAARGVRGRVARARHHCTRAPRGTDPRQRWRAGRSALDLEQWRAMRVGPCGGRAGNVISPRPRALL